MQSTPRRKIKTSWTEVQTFCKITMEVSKINRAVDEIKGKSLRDAGFRSEHVSHTKATDRVNWKSTHVSDARKLVTCNREWYYSDFVFGACAQSYRSCKDSEKHDELFRCPCAYLCGCQVQFQICATREYTKEMVSGKRDGNSHVETVRDKVYQKLSLTQTGALRRATKVAPNETARQIARNPSNLSPDKCMPSDPSSIRAAQRFVSQERRMLALQQTQGVKLDKTSWSMASLGSQFDLAKLIAMHNDEGDDFHFDLHTIICIRSQWQGGVTFTELSTPQIMFNLGRAIQSEWKLQIQSDGSFAFCSAEIGVIVFGVNSLGSVFKLVSWSIVPNESSEAFTYAHNCIRAAFFGLFKKGAVRLCEQGSACDCCEQLRDIQESPEVAKVVNIVSNSHEELPVKRAGVDNTTKWSSFATRILKHAKVLVCYANATGES